MIIVLLGAAGSGKSTIENQLSTQYGFEKIVSYTTRKPRDNEVNGKDYWFIDNGTFEKSINRNLFAEYDEYSQNRLYGTLKSDYVDGNKVVVLTPNGLRQLKKSCPNEDIFTVLVEASLGTRIKRYIDRIGANNFTYDDKNEIASRVERDYSMFLGAEREANLIIQNEDGCDISVIGKQIIEAIGSWFQACDYIIN